MKKNTITCINWMKSLLAVQLSKIPDEGVAVISIKLKCKLSKGNKDGELDQENQLHEQAQELPIHQQIKCIVKLKNTLQCQGPETASGKAGKIKYPKTGSISKKARVR